MIDLDAVMDGGLDAVVDTGVGNASVPATAATQEEERARSGKAKPKEGGTVLHSGQDFQCPDCRTISTELWKPSHFMDFPLCSICQELEVNCVYASCQHAKTCDRCALQFGAGASSTHSGDGAAGSGAGDPPTKKPKIDDLLIRRYHMDTLRSLLQRFRSKKNKSHVEQFDREIHTSISGLRALHPCDFKDLDSSMAARHWRGDVSTRESALLYILKSNVYSFYLYPLFFFFEHNSIFKGKQCFAYLVAVLYGVGINISKSVSTL